MWGLLSDLTDGVPSSMTEPVRASRTVGMVCVENEGICRSICEVVAGKDCNLFFSQRVIWGLMLLFRVKFVPHRGQGCSACWPAFSLECLSRLLKVEKGRPLQPCSQHSSFLPDSKIRGSTSTLYGGCCETGVFDSCEMGGRRIWGVAYGESTEL